MIDGSSRSLAIIVRAALLLPVLTVVAGADLRNYRTWRERVARWRRDGIEPPPEYRVDNRRWRIRLAGLAVAAAGFVTLTIYLFARDGSELGVIGPLYAVTMVGAGIWGLLRAWVR